MNQAKLDFICKDFLPLLKTLNAQSIGCWGKMNAQQMTEHVAGFFQVSSNKLHFKLVTPAEHLPKYKEFLLSDKEFRENTKAPVLPEEPMPVRFPDMETALQNLQNEIDAFVDYFKDQPGLKTQHPVFGELDFDEWILLHYKHVTHHARQFGLMK